MPTQWGQRHIPGSLAGTSGAAFASGAASALSSGTTARRRRWGGTQIMSPVGDGQFPVGQHPQRGPLGQLAGQSSAEADRLRVAVWRAGPEPGPPAARRVSARALLAFTPRCGYSWSLLSSEVASERFPTASAQIWSY